MNNELVVKGSEYTVRYSVELDPRIESVEVDGKFIVAVSRKAATELRKEAVLYGVRELVCIVAAAPAEEVA